MRLLYLLNQRFPTDKAYGVQVAKMCAAFAGLGVQVELIAPTRKNSFQVDPREYYGTNEAYRITSVQSPDWYFPGTFDRIAFWMKNVLSALRLVSAARSREVDVWYSRDELPLVFGIMGRHPRHVFLELHRYARTRSLMYRFLASRGVRFVAITRQLRDDLIRSGIPTQSVSVAPDGYDSNAFATLPDQGAARHRVHLPMDLPIALYAGHLYRWKGADLLAEAARYIKGLVVLVGGTAADLQSFKKRFSETPNILFVGHRPHAEIVDWLRAANVLVLPNRSDERISRLYTSPLKLFEYMASGIPIVASDLPAIREILSEDSAFFFPADDAAALGRVVQAILDGTTQTTQQVQYAMKLAQGFSWDARARTIFTLTDV